MRTLPFGYEIKLAYRVWNNSSGILEEVHDVQFDETNGSQDEEENLDDRFMMINLMLKH